MAVVLITGCSSGIGLETSLAFARRGDTVVASMRNPDKAGRLQERADAEGLGVHVVALDVTDDRSVEEATAAVEAAHGPIEVLVNNAGVGFGGPAETMDIERARAVLETNLWGPVRTIRAVLPGMRTRRRGVIVNVSSVAGRVPGNPFQTFYGISKHGLGVLSEGLRAELEPFGVRVACIEPGFFATDIFANSEIAVASEGPYQAHEAWIGEFMAKSAEGAAGDPAVVAAAIVRAVDDPDTPMHTLVGDDAVMFVDMVNQAGTFEQWMQVARQIVESVAGPQP